MTRDAVFRYYELQAVRRAMAVQPQNRSYFRSPEKDYNFKRVHVRFVASGGLC